MEFLKSISVKEAEEKILSFPFELKEERVEIVEALDRICSAPVEAKEDIPSFSRSLVDGYAVIAKDTFGARETLPLFLYLIGEVKVGERTDLELKEGQAVYVNTGAMIPNGAESVIMQEYVRRAGNFIEVTKAVSPKENIIFKGEDIKKGQIIIEKGEKITPFHLGVLSSLGIEFVNVFKRPLVSYFSTGDEIVEIGETPPPGKVRDINRYTIEGLLRKEGVEVKVLGIARDREEEIIERIESALNSDIIIVSGGSSKGERDLISNSVERIGGRIIFHGINIKPGKPTIFAEIKGKAFFGLPGHPLSCIMVMLRFVLPFIKRAKGEILKEKRGVKGVISQAIPSSLGIEEYVIVKKEGDLFVPLFSKSSSISSLLSATGYIVIPEEKEGIEKGEEVEVFSFYE